MQVALPWNDRAGRLSWLKLACFAACLAPGLWIILQWSNEMLGVRPVTETIHQTGDWAIRFLLISLCITPLRRVAQYPKLVTIRRMLGLTCLAYAAIHFTLFIVDQKYDLVKVATEILLRFYLTLGFLGLLGLAALGLTSTDAAIRRLGALRWNRLHQLVYPIAIIGLVHFALQSKRDVTEAMMLAGMFTLLMLARWLDSRGKASALSLVALALFSALACALMEAGWYAVASGIDPVRLLAADIDPEMLPRPWVWVLLAGLLLAGLRWWRGRKVVAGAVRGRIVESAR